MRGRPVWKLGIVLMAMTQLVWLTLVLPWLSLVLLVARTGLPPLRARFTFEFVRQLLQQYREFPRYQMPQLRDIALGLWQRAWIFLRRAGTIIAMTTVVLWLLLTFPQAPKGESQVEYSIAGRLGHAGVSDRQGELIGDRLQWVDAGQPADYQVTEDGQLRRLP